MPRQARRAGHAAPCRLQVSVQVAAGQVLQTALPRLDIGEGARLSESTVRSLRGRIRWLTVGLTVAFGLTMLLAASRLRVLEGSVTAVLSRNYRSIEAAAAVGRTVDALQVVVRDGGCAEHCTALRSEFERWLAIEFGNCTEAGETELAHAVDARGHHLFAAALANADRAAIDADARAVQADVEALIALNKSAMFDADRHTRALATRLMLALCAGVVAFTLVIALVGWRLANAVTRPLQALADRLRTITPGGPYPTLRPQALAELEAVAVEYRRMAHRLADFERLNIDALRDEQAKVEAIIESIDDGLILMDNSGVIRHVNGVASAILGLEQRQLLGARFEDLATDQPHFVRIRAAMREFVAQPERDRERIELTLFLRGRDHHYVLRPMPFAPQAAGERGLILVLQDVTYIRDQAAQREHLLATLSHELGSPLTSLRMALELLARDRDRMTPPQQGLVDTAQEDIGRLQDVAQHLLDLSRSRATSIAIERRNVDLAEVIDRMIRIFLPQAKEKGVALDAVLSGQALTIVGDPTKLTWALSNLLSNALRYTPRNGRVGIEASSEPHVVLVSVSDTGPGISAEQQERIFDRFVQSGEGGAIGSAGLGLAIVRDIVQAHGGRIRLESEVGHGSRFTLELPRG